MKKSELRQLIKEEISKVLKEQAELYPSKASPKTIALYDRIANELKKTILLVSQKLNTPQSNIRVILEALGTIKNNKKESLYIQIKAQSDTWEEARFRNESIMQTPDNDGVVISSLKISLDDYNDFTEELIPIYSLAKKQNLLNIREQENLRILNLFTPNDRKLITPDSPIIITGK